MMSVRHRMLFCTVVILAGATSAQSLADALASPIELKIKPQSTVQGGIVTLADVLAVPAAGEGELPANLDRAAVANNLQAPATLVITYEQIAGKLSELGVNPARVLLSGAARCVVAVTAPTAAPVEQQCAAAAPRPNCETGGEKSMAQVLREHVATEIADLGGTAEIEFERAGEPFLALTTPAWEFSIRSADRTKLGPREFQVALRRDGKNVRTATIMARVQLSKEVLVARSPLNVGTLVQREALGREPRIFQREQDLGLGRIEQAVGQRVTRFVAAGQMLTAGDLKSEQLVQRSRPVTILGGNGNLNVRLTGVALDSGVYGDEVRVRVGDSRQSRNILRGTVTGMSTIRVEEGR